MRQSDHIDEFIREIMEDERDILSLSTLEIEQVLERMMLMQDAFQESEYASVAAAITKMAAEALALDYEPPEIEDPWEFEDSVITESISRGNTYWEIENDQVH